MWNLIIFIVTIAVAYFIGTLVEIDHYKIVEKKEKEFLHLPTVTNEELLDNTREVEKSELITGSVVISIDYFKRMLAGLRNIVGGEISSYETLIDRGRREAVLRMKQQAVDADIILNLRIETSAIAQSANKRKESIGSIEVLAYATAITFKK